MSECTDKTARQLRAAQRLEMYRSDLEYGPGNVAATLDLALRLIHASDWIDDEAADQHATNRNVCALLGCARLATDQIDHIMGGVWDLMDAEPTRGAKA